VELTMATQQLRAEVLSTRLDVGALVSCDSLALMRTQHSTFIEPDRGPDVRLELTGYGYGHNIGTFDGRPAALHTGDNLGYKSLVGWLPEGRPELGVKKGPVTTRVTAG
jgi:hypothetical protein